MATVPLLTHPEADPRVKAVFDDIRATRQTDFVNNLWRALAFDPPLLERTWAEVKALMATTTLLDPLTKELIYIAVSITNGCGYCVHSHTAAARAKGLSDAMHAELLSIVALAARTNQLATGCRSRSTRVRRRPRLRRRASAEAHGDVEVPAAADLDTSYWRAMAGGKAVRTMPCTRRGMASSMASRRWCAPAY